VLLGIDWYEEMYFPSNVGLITPQGDVTGGHALVVIGYRMKGRNLTDLFFLLHNSWGEGWGIGGRCWISGPDLQMLISAPGAEAVVATKIPR
jgi:C1A family cysteine protease